MNFVQLKNKVALGIRRRGPEILIVLGVTGTVAAAVKACVDTHKKLNPILEKRNERLASARKIEVEKEQKREVAKAYITTGFDLFLLYMPAAAVEALSISAIFASNHILRKRMIALAAAYATIDQSFRDYRARVVERYGEEADLELRHGIHQEKIELTETDAKGREKKVERLVAVADGSMPSDYARYFAKGDAKSAESNYDYNLMFVKAQQEVANHRLRSLGCLFLNEVYDMLGIKLTVAGQSVGWVYDESNPNNDNYVDFGIREVYRKDPDNPDELERVILLDFNVDGNIQKHCIDIGLIDEK